jgi:hypothetical protein
VKIVLAAGLAIAGGLLTAGVGTATAEPTPVPGNYATSDTCQAAGTAGGGIGGDFTRYSCDQHEDRLWYLTMLD